MGRSTDESATPHDGDPGAARAELPPPASIASAPHSTRGQACDGWRQLDGENLSVTEERMPPGTHERWHGHDRAQQFFHLLSGRLVVERGGSSTSLRRREGISVPPGVAHRVSNASAEDAVFLVISSPPTAGDRTDVEPDTGAS